MEKTPALVLAALLLSPGTIVADGPARLEVSKDQPIIAPPEAVWAAIDAVTAVYKAGLDNLKSLLERGARGP